MLWSWIGKTRDGSGNCFASDVHLSERLKQRDQLAFLDLYDHNHRSVYKFLMHMTGSITIAEDLTQEVFVVILDSMCTGTVGQFDPGRGTWEGYLLGIARNLARAERRRANRAVSLDSVLETPEWNQFLKGFSQNTQAWDVAGLLETRSEIKALYLAILELPEHYREAVVLCGLQEKTYRDAAVILQCSEGTIASRMNRAKGLLAAKLHRAAWSPGNSQSIMRGKEGLDVATAAKTDRR